MEDYPKSLVEFKNWFSTEQACRDYLYRLRWPNGFVCPQCGNSKAWCVATVLYECSKCHHQSSVIAGTVFQDTHKPLTVWFRAIWWVTGQKSGCSALGLQRILGLGSYRTAWAWLHKLRRAMVRPDLDKLTNIVEIKQTLIPTKGKLNKRGRGKAGKTLIGVAAEDKSQKDVGRISLGILKDGSPNSLMTFVRDRVVKGSVIRTNKWRAYKGLKSLGYYHIPGENNELKRANYFVHELNYWFLNTYSGPVSFERLPYYLDEYTFRINQRILASQGKLFMHLLKNAVQIKPCHTRPDDLACQRTQTKRI